MNESKNSVPTAVEGKGRTGEAGGLFQLEKVLKVMRSPCSVEQIKDLVMRCDCIRYIT